MSVFTVQFGLLLMGMIVINTMAAPSMDERQLIYVDTCQTSCGLVSNNAEQEECRENFCPTYVHYLITGVAQVEIKPSLASTNQREVVDFCAMWVVHLIEQMGWQNRIKLNLKECVCAAGKDCLVK